MGCATLAEVPVLVVGIFNVLMTSLSYAVSLRWLPGLLALGAVGIVLYVALSRVRLAWLEQSWPASRRRARGYRETTWANTVPLLVVILLFLATLWLQTTPLWLQIFP